jgi:hypothetical protein
MAHPLEAYTVDVRELDRATSEQITGRFRGIRRGAGVPDDVAGGGSD